MKYAFYFIGMMCVLLGGLISVCYETFVESRCIEETPWFCIIRDIVHICSVTLAWVCECMIYVVVTTYVGFWIILRTSIGRLLGVRVYAERFLGWLAWIFVDFFLYTFARAFISDEELERG